MGNLTYKTVKIEITYSNVETRKEGVFEGDIYDGQQEFYKGKPKSSVQFKSKSGADCIAYDVQHDDDLYVAVTTCKILDASSFKDKLIQSEINLCKANIKQLRESELFSAEDRERLIPIYENRLKMLLDKTDILHQIEVNNPEILSNNQPGA